MDEALFQISAEELRQFATQVVDKHLDYYADRLTYAAELGHKRTQHAHTFAVAVHASVLLAPQPHNVVARNALQVHEGLEVVGQVYPELTNRTEAQWHEAVNEAWQAVQFTPDAIRPQDRSVFGHIELLEALRKHTATYGRLPKRAS